MQKIDEILFLKGCSMSETKQYNNVKLKKRQRMMPLAGTYYNIIIYFENSIFYCAQVFLDFGTMQLVCSTL
jgi:hypothetical protein